MRNPVEGKNIIIIGSGIGGLSTGILLSLLNFKVTIVEKNPRPGGLMRSYSRSGLDCPVGVHYVGALGAVMASAVDKGDILKDEKARKQAFDLGKKAAAT